MWLDFCCSLDNNWLKRASEDLKCELLVVSCLCSFFVGVDDADGNADFFEGLVAIGLERV